jgi:hypothetical protein
LLITSSLIIIRVSIKLRGEINLQSYFLAGGSLYKRCCALLLLLSESKNIGKKKE